MEYNITLKEIKRRKVAFLSLISSLFIALIIYSLLFNFDLKFISYFILLILFIFVSIITFKFLNNLSLEKLFLNENEIQIKKGRKVRKYTVNEIHNIKVKRRPNNVIREITITFTNKSVLYLSAYEDNFEEILNFIINRIYKDILIKQFNEFMDFDAALFYPALGQLLGFFTIVLMKLISNIDFSATKIIFAICSIYNFLLAIYFIIKKPISSKSGEKVAISDFIFSSVLLMGGLLFLLFLF